MRRRRSLKPLLFLIGLVLIGLFAGRAYFNYLLSPVDSSNTERVLFVIPPGQSTSQIADRLEKDGFIRSSFAFKYLVSQTGQGDKIQAGDFKISPAMKAREILTELTVGVVDKWVTLIEGWRVEEVARKLNQELGIGEADFLKSAEEGYMFPDTYLVDPKIIPSDMVGLLQSTFNQRYTDELKAEIRANGLTPEQGVILASIVEREGRSDKVRVEVASILLKRIKIGMKLDADATVQYAKDTVAYKANKNHKFWTPVIQADYQDVKSPYNTYLNNGLPPGPICNPSLSSLKAVAQAHDTPYLYYYHDTKGNSYYATTLEEHNENVANHR